MAAPQIVIIGAGGHAVSVAETANAQGYQITSFAVHNPTQTHFIGIPIVAIESLKSTDSTMSFVVAIGDNFTRERVLREVTSFMPIEQFPVLTHPSASVSPFTKLGSGTVVLQGAVVGSYSNTGIGCLINSGAVVDHECDLGDFSSVAPNATLGGRVHIGARTAISIGAVVKHGLTIGADTVVGAASYVHQDLPSGIVAFGSPAKRMRARQVSDSYL